MNENPQQYEYYPVQYQPMFWQGLVAGVVDVVIMVAMGAWALSLVKKAFKGEEVVLK